jgi:hypothetical protein
MYLFRFLTTLPFLVFAIYLVAFGMAYRRWAPSSRWRGVRCLAGGALFIELTVAGTIPNSARSTWLELTLEAVALVCIALIVLASVNGRREERLPPQLSSDQMEGQPADPGWRAALHGMMPVLRKNQHGTEGITVLRVMFLGIAASLPLWLVAFSYIAPWDGGDEGWAPFIVVTVGLAGARRHRVAEGASLASGPTSAPTVSSL